MNFFKLGRNGAAIVLVALTATFGFARARAKESSGKTEAGRLAESGEDLFTGQKIFRIQIEIPPKGMATLREYNFSGWGGGEPAERTSVKCTVREGTNTYQEVTVHLKGSAGSFRPVDANPGLTLNFGKYVKSQSFHGLQRFSLNNSVQDPSLLSEQISRELSAAAGVPVPRATQAVVELNGRKLGVYVLVEAYNKQFLARHFNNTKGNLYDGGFVKDIDSQLVKSSGANPNDRSDLEKLALNLEEVAKRGDFHEAKKQIDLFENWLNLQI